MRKDYHKAVSLIEDYDSYHCMGTLYLVRAPNSIAYSLEERVFVSVEVEWNKLQGGLTADEAACLIAQFPDKVSYWNPIPEGKKMGYGNEDKFVGDRNRRIDTTATPKKLSDAEQTILAWFELSKEERQEAARSLLDKKYLELDDRLQIVVSKKRDAR